MGVRKCEDSKVNGQLYSTWASGEDREGRGLWLLCTEGDAERKPTIMIAKSNHHH